MLGAESLLKTFVDGGVQVCFANPGSTEMDIIRAFDQVEGMRAVLCLFEGVASGAADGYARVSGRSATTLLHVGPGLANALANLHNARRARSPLINLVGDYPTYHRAYDALLEADLESLARPMSGWVRVAGDAGSLGQDGAEAVAAAALGQVATLIVPADAAWGDGGQVAAVAWPELPAVAADRVEQAARALKQDAGAILLIAGAGMSEAGLVAANRIVAATGCRLLADTFAARIDRGRGRGSFGPVPGDQPRALEVFGSAGHVILAGARVPVAHIAYPGLPSELIPDGTSRLVLAQPGDDVVAALCAVADALDAPEAGPCYEASIPDLPTGPLTAHAVGAALAALMPESAIVSAEPTTSGGPAFGLTRGAAPHIWLPITGGAIGQGMPVAVGAAVAAPEAKVICLQADGGGMYTNQALWTMAREGLDITTVILSNRQYRILAQEYLKDGANELGATAARLFDLSEPTIDWAGLARALGVEAVQVETAEDLCAQLRRGLDADGPYLIEALL